MSDICKKELAEAEAQWLADRTDASFNRFYTLALGLALRYVSKRPDRMDIATDAVHRLVDKYLRSEGFQLGQNLSGRLYHEVLYQVSGNTAINRAKVENVELSDIFPHPEPEQVEVVWPVSKSKVVAILSQHRGRTKAFTALAEAFPEHRQWFRQHGTLLLHLHSEVRPVSIRKSEVNDLTYGEILQYLNCSEAELLEGIKAWQADKSA